MTEHPHPAYEHLIENLKAAVSATPQRDDAETNQQRERALKAIAAVMEFFREIGMERRLYAPLLDLAGALVDANDGRANPMLAPTPNSHAPRQLVRERYDRAASAAAVTILKDYAKRRLSDALMEVSRLTGIDKKELAEFRKNILRKRANPEVIENYNFFLKMARSLPHPPAEQARRALQVVIEMRPSEKG